MPTEAHWELCNRMMVPSSDRLARIWEMLADEQEARLLLAMPASVAELAEQSALPEEQVAVLVEGLYHRGVAFKAAKPQGLIFRAPRHLIQLHDASNQWPEAPEAFFATWREFMAEEYPDLLGLMFAAGFPAFMRVVPTMAAAADQAQAEAHEDLAAMIEAATELAICRCPCSLVEGRCDELNRCLQVGKGARYALDRGTGRALSKTEALALLRQAEDRGLVHTVENKRGLGSVICNCCTCCCAIIKPALDHPDKCAAVLAPSRFAARVNPEHCSGDGLCADTCPVGAIALPDGVALVDQARCLGCGLCLGVCPTEAIAFPLVREDAFGPG